MIFDFSAEHDEFRSVVRSFLAEVSSEPDLRRLMETQAGFDGQVWRRMAEQLGIQGILIPEELGGSGGTFVDLGIVVEEMGRSLMCSPFFATSVLAVSLLSASGDAEAVADYLPGIAAGSTVATVAVTESSGQWSPDAINLAGTLVHGDWQLTGEKLFVLDGLCADVILVAARTRSGISLFAVERAASGLSVAPLDSLDRTRKLTRMRLDQVSARLLGADGDGWAAIAAMLDRAVAALAVEQAGGAHRVLDMAVSHAKTRYQFGRPIGGFQAVKHRCADLLVDVELARSAAYAACWSIADGRDDLSLVAAAAQSLCSDVFLRATAQNIQLHGGMGFTWEHPAHLYYRRAIGSSVIFGDSTHHRELFMRRLGY